MLTLDFRSHIIFTNSQGSRQSQKNKEVTTSHAGNKSRITSSASPKRKISTHIANSTLPLRMLSQTVKDGTSATGRDLRNRQRNLITSSLVLACTPYQTSQNSLIKRNSKERLCTQRVSLMVSKQKGRRLLWLVVESLLLTALLSPVIMEFRAHYFSAQLTGHVLDILQVLYPSAGTLTQDSAFSCYQHTTIFLQDSNSCIVFLHLSNGSGGGLQNRSSNSSMASKENVFPSIILRSMFSAEDRF